MALYFFGCHDGETTHVDEEGISCRDSGKSNTGRSTPLPISFATNCRTAMSALFEIGVRDEEGQPVFRCWLTFRLTWP